MKKPETTMNPPKKQEPPKATSKPVGGQAPMQKPPVANPTTTKR